MKSALLKKLEEVFRTLSQVDRQILMLHWAEDLTPFEISYVLNVPEREVLDTMAGLRHLVTHHVLASRPHRRVA